MTDLVAAAVVVVVVVWLLVVAVHLYRGLGRIGTDAGNGFLEKSAAVRRGNNLEKVKTAPGKIAATAATKLQPGPIALSWPLLEKKTVDDKHKL